MSNFRYLPLLLLIGCANNNNPAANATSPRQCAPTNRKGVYAAEIVDSLGSKAVLDSLEYPFGVKDDDGFDRVVDQFYRERGDEWDFLFLYVPRADYASKVRRAAALHVHVAPREERTLGLFSRGRSSLSKRHPRLRSVIVLSLPQKSGGGPHLHEIAHYWGNGLGGGPWGKNDLGFPTSSHWGVTGVKGQLGGFDGEKLVCREPKGAVPPNCTIDLEGRFDVYIPGFGGGGDYTPFGDLELYLMGLIGPDELRPIKMLDDAVKLKRHLYSVTGVHTVSAVDITAAMGGPPPPRLDQDRPLRAAFALVQPESSPGRLARVAAQARAFGNVDFSPQFSYCSATGGRSSFRTDL